MGQTVTAQGIPQFNADALFVTQIQPTDSSSRSQGKIATLSFELTVKGDPPADTQFFGAPGEGGGQFFDAEGNRLGPVPLTDPDGDGVFTGSTTLANPGTGPVVSLPVQIVQENGGNIEVIRDFGVVGIDGDRTFRARANFKDNGGGTTTPEPGNSGSTDDSDVPGSVGSDDSDAPSSSGSSDSGSGESGSGESGSGESGSGGSGNVAESSGSPSGVTNEIRGLLPSTGGGITLTVLIAGVLLIGGGLLIRRLSR